MGLVPLVYNVNMTLTKNIFFGIVYTFYYLKHIDSLYLLILASSGPFLVITKKYEHLILETLEWAKSAKNGKFLHGGDTAPCAHFLNLDVGIDFFLNLGLHFFCVFGSAFLKKMVFI